MTCSTYPTICVVQGETWQKLVVSLGANETYPDGDFTDWVGSGQIRNGRSDKGGELLAEFTFPSPLYDSENLKTIFMPTLDAETTKDLPITKYQGAGDPSDKSALIYDLEFSFNGLVKKLAPGYVRVIGEANRDELA